MDDVLSNLENIFSTVDAEAKRAATKDSPARYPFDMTRAANRGTVFGAIIPDKNNKTLRIIRNVTSTWLSYVDENGQQRRTEALWCDSSNYTNLTAHQVELNAKLKAAIDKFAAIHEGEQGFYVKNSSQVSVFYFAFKKFISQTDEVTKYDNPEVFVMVHKSAQFPKAFSAAVKAKTNAFDSNEWVKDYFTRKEGNQQNITQIDTRMGQARYDIAMQFNILPNNAFAINASHLERASDIYSEYIDANMYNEDRANFLLGLLEKEIAAAANSGTVTLDGPTLTLSDSETIDLP